MLKSLIAPKVSSKKLWTSQGVRNICIENNYYTRGDERDYADMLSFVDSTDPTDKNLYIVAVDIFEHSKLGYEEGYNQNEILADIMYTVNSSTCTIYAIDEGIE